MSDSQINDEIDLFEVFQILWSGKWLILAFSGAIGAIVGAFLLILPSKSQVSLSFSQLSQQQLSAYAPLNNVPGISPPIYTDGVFIGQTGVISAEGLLANTHSDIRSGQSLRTAISELDERFINFDGTEAEKAEALILASQDFRLEIQEDMDDSLTTITTNPDRAKAIFSRFIDIAQQNIRQQNLAGIANLSKSIEINLAYEIEALEAEIQNDKQTYFDSLNGRIALLNEHASIARTVNQAAPSQSMSINATVSTSQSDEPDEADKNMFMRGYKALEEESRLLKNRKADSWKLFMPGYNEKAAKLRELRSDKRLARLESGLILSPLSEAEGFTPVNFDENALSVTPAGSKRLTTILVTLLAAILASLFVLFRYYARKRAVGTA